MNFSTSVAHTRKHLWPVSTMGTLAIVAAAAGVTAWLPAWSNPPTLLATLCVALSCAGLVGLKLLRTRLPAPAAPPASPEERWQQASALINDVALQANRLALLALIELERSEAGTPARAQLAEQLRLLARHSADSARAIRAAGPSN